MSQTLVSFICITYIQNQPVLVFKFDNIPIILQKNEKNEWDYQRAYQDYCENSNKKIAYNNFVETIIRVLKLNFTNL